MEHLASSQGSREPPFRYTESDSHRDAWRDTLSPFLVRPGDGGSDRMAWNSHHHRSAWPPACGIFGLGVGLIGDEVGLLLTFGDYQSEITAQVLRGLNLSHNPRHTIVSVPRPTREGHIRCQRRRTPHTCRNLSSGLLQYILRFQQSGPWVTIRRSRNGHLRLGGVVRTSAQETAALAVRIYDAFCRRVDAWPRAYFHPAFVRT